jgi:hypothetical protein
MTDPEVFEWDGPWLADHACALCGQPFADQPGSCTQYAAYLFHLHEPDRVCADCVTGRKRYVLPSARYGGPLICPN